MSGWKSNLGIEVKTSVEKIQQYDEKYKQRGSKKDSHQTKTCCGQAADVAVGRKQ
jgi:hypothetical protein